MGFLITADLNEAHEQANKVWARLSKSQDRDLLVMSDTQLNEPVYYYGTDSYSSKCHEVRGSGFMADENLPKGQLGVNAWNGSIRITGVVSFWIETHSGHDAKFNENVRKYAREIIVFKCYSLVSRAGTNVCHVQAQRHGGVIMKGSVLPFDYSRADGGYNAGMVAMSHMLGATMKSEADYRLSGAARRYHLRDYSEDCYDIPDSQENNEWSDEATSWNGTRYEIVGSIRDRHDCLTELQMRYPK